MSPDALRQTLIHLWFTSVSDELDDELCCWGEYFLTLNNRTDCLTFPVSVQRYIHEYAVGHFAYNAPCDQHLQYSPVYRAHCCAHLSPYELKPWLDNEFLPEGSDVEELTTCLKRYSDLIRAGAQISVPSEFDPSSIPVLSPNSPEYIELALLCPNLISFSNREEVLTDVVPDKPASTTLLFHNQASDSTVSVALSSHLCGTTQPSDCSILPQASVMTPPPSLPPSSREGDDACGLLAAPARVHGESVFQAADAPVPCVSVVSCCDSTDIPDSDTDLLVSPPAPLPPKRRKNDKKQRTVDAQVPNDLILPNEEERAEDDVCDVHRDTAEGVDLAFHPRAGRVDGAANHNGIRRSVVLGNYGRVIGLPERGDGRRFPPPPTRHRLKLARTDVGRDYIGLFIVLLISILISYLPKILSEECTLPDSWECAWTDGLCVLPKLPHCLPDNRYKCEHICLHYTDSDLYSPDNSQLVMYPARGYPNWLPHVTSAPELAALVLLGSLGNQLRFASMNDGHLVTLGSSCQDRFAYLYCRYLDPKFLSQIKYPDGGSILASGVDSTDHVDGHHVLRPFIFGCRSTSEASLHLSACGFGPGYLAGNLSATWFPTQELVTAVSNKLCSSAVDSILRSYLFEKIHHGVAICFEFNTLSVALSSAYVPPNLNYILISPRLRTPYYYHPGGSPVVYVSVFDEYRLKRFKNSIRTYAPDVAYLFNDHGSTVFSTCDRLITALQYILRNFDARLNQIMSISFGLTRKDDEFNIRFPSAVPPKHWDNILPGDSYFSALREESLDDVIIGHYSVDYDSLYHDQFLDDPQLLYRHKRGLSNHSDSRHEYDTEYRSYSELYRSTNGAEKLDIYNIVTDANRLRKVLTPESSFFSSDYVKSVHDLNELFSPTNFASISDSTTVETGYLNLIRNSDPLNVGDGKANLVRELFHPFTLVDEVCQITSSTNAPKALTILRGWPTRDMIAIYAKHSGVEPSKIVESLYTRCGVSPGPTVNHILEVEIRPTPAPEVSTGTKYARSPMSAATNLKIFRKMIRRKGRRLSYLISVPTLDIIDEITRDAPIHIRILEDACTWHRYSPISLTTSRVIAKNAKHAILFTTSEYISDVDDDEQFHAVSAWNGNLCNSLALASPGSVLQKLLGCTF